jgi:hypothetical protein
LYILWIVSRAFTARDYFARSTTVIKRQYSYISWIVSQASIARDYFARSTTVSILSTYRHLVVVCLVYLICFDLVHCCISHTPNNLLVTTGPNAWKSALGVKHIFTCDNAAGRLCASLMYTGYPIAPSPFWLNTNACMYTVSAFEIPPPQQPLGQLEHVPPTLWPPSSSILPSIHPSIHQLTSVSCTNIQIPAMLSSVIQYPSSAINCHPSSIISHHVDNNIDFICRH